MTHSNPYGNAGMDCRINENNRIKEGKMQKLGITTQELDQEIVLFLDGEVDLGNIKGLEDALRMARAGSKNLVIDMEHVRFIDSTGIGLLVKTYKVLKQDNRSIEVRNARGNVRKVFKITCLEDVFNMGVEA